MCANLNTVQWLLNYNLKLFHPFGSINIVFNIIYWLKIFALTLNWANLPNSLLSHTCVEWFICFYRFAYIEYCIKMNAYTGCDLPITLANLNNDWKVNSEIELTHFCHCLQHNYFVVVFLATNWSKLLNPPAFFKKPLDENSSKCAKIVKSESFKSAF